MHAGGFGILKGAGKEHTQAFMRGHGTMNYEDVMFDYFLGHLALEDEASKAVAVEAQPQA